MAAIRMIVSGRVQGVGFRYFVSRQAERLGLRGEVWNRRDGRVEVVATHLDPARLAALEQELYLGPGRVDNVRSEAIEFEVAYDSFSIGPTR